MRLPPSVHERVPAGPLAHGVRDLGRDSLDVSAIRAIDADDRGVPPVGTHQDNCLAAGCGQPRALRVMADRHGLSGADGCRAGAGRAVLEGGTGAPGPGRVGGDEDPSPCLQVYGDARPPDEASRIGAGMRCRMGSRTSHTAGRRSAPRTNSSRCWLTSIPTQADRLGGCRGWLRAQSQGGASRPRLSACASPYRGRASTR